MGLLASSFSAEGFHKKSYLASNSRRKFTEMAKFFVLLFSAACLVAVIASSHESETYMTEAIAPAVDTTELQGPTKVPEQLLQQVSPSAAEMQGAKLLQTK